MEPRATYEPVSNKSEFISPFPPVPNFVIYPCVHPVIPEAVIEPENPVDQVASPLASEVRILPSHGEPQPIVTCPER